VLFKETDHVTFRAGHLAGSIPSTKTFPRERHDMNTLTTPVDDKAAAAVAGLPRTAPRTVVADPWETPSAPQGVEPNGILIWTNRSKNYPVFAIEFQGSAIPGNPNFPASVGDVLIGAGSVVVHMAGAGNFNYKIRHIPTSGDDLVSNTFAVRSCVGC
jgi:hypothetical protein